MDIKERNLRLRQEKLLADKAKQASTELIPEGSGLKDINKVIGTTEKINIPGEKQVVSEAGDWINKIAAKRAAMQAAKSGGMKALGLLAGPVGVALNAADAMAGSENVGEGSDMIAPEAEESRQLVQQANAGEISPEQFQRLREILKNR
jgi:hypothetical protein